MCNLRPLTRSCGQPIPPGVKQTIYLIPAEEITDFPDAETSTAAGDTKRLDGPFVMSTVEGKGYWRAVSVLVNSGNHRNTLAGEIGGQKIEQRMDFFVQGNGPEQAEFIDTLLCQSGCLIALIPAKDGNYLVMGDPENPVYIEAAEGGTGGDRNGHQITLYTDTGYTPMYYDAETDGIDVTPSPAPE
jgi:hypothetical protein